MSIICDFIPGCTDPDACNFDIDAEQNNGTCIFPDHCQDCDGNCLGESAIINGVVVDCTADNCGTCGGQNDCCAAEENFPDCAGDCNGEAIVNECGDCVHPDANPCVEGCDGVWANQGSQAIVDGCGNCSPLADTFCDPSLSWAANPGCDFCCDGTPVCPGTMPGSCGSEVIDDCGVCFGDGTSCDASILFHGFDLKPTPPTSWAFQDNIWGVLTQLLFT